MLRYVLAARFGELPVSHYEVNLLPAICLRPSGVIQKVKGLLLLSESANKANQWHFRGHTPSSTHRIRFRRRVVDETDPLRIDPKPVLKRNGDPAVDSDVPIERQDGRVAIATDPAVFGVVNLLVDDRDGGEGIPKS